LVIITIVEDAVEPDYAQFYAKSPEADWLSDQVSDLAYETKLEARAGFVYLGTARRYGTTRLRIEVHDSEPAEPDVRWQHVAEVSLATSGVLEIHDWGADEPAMSVSVPAGPIRLRASWTGLVAGRGGEGLDQDGTSDERLMLQIWTALPADPAVRRWWAEWRLPERSAVSADGRRQVEGLESVIARLIELRRLPVKVHSDLGNPRFPGEAGRGQLVGVHGDVGEGTWWADGYAVRRTLREVTDAEVRQIMAAGVTHPWPLYRRRASTTLLEMPSDQPPLDSDDTLLAPANQAWLEMLARIGYPTVVKEI